MSEEKTKCQNPECVGDEHHPVTENIKSYSLEHYGIVLCYPCQELVKSGKLNAEALKEALKKKDTLEGYVGEEEEELEKYDEEVSGEAGTEVNELNGDKTVEIDEGEFSFREEDGKLLCKNGVSDKTYWLDVEVPYCPCMDFLANKKEKEWCKHLKAASVAGYPVKELPKPPEEVAKALVTQEPEKGKTPHKRIPKPKKEETIALTIMGKDVQMPVQVPGEIIRNEEAATKMIIDIIGTKPLFKDVIEKFGDIEEISADVIISLAQYSGIRFQILNKETETATMNLGKIFKSVPMSEDKRNRYADIADFMPDTDVVVRCKITSIAVWKDKAGGMRVGTGTKEEHLTPYELKDIVMRGANFIETKCESKSFKKAISNALPVTHDGLLQKIKATYGW